ncbi:MAG: toprim domain-containing protein [Nanoarchaeota archaeon]|nr:toprim domain-containing protein [Nanoarchaeota archaeon]
MKELLDWLSKLKESGKLIIVEGKKDKKALESLGVHDIITLNKPLFEIVEEAASRNQEVILLTDFDRKGKELYGKLKKDLIKNGVKVDLYFREFLQKNTRLSHIEGLGTFFKNHIPF